jgi:hypothetical protein
MNKTGSPADNTILRIETNSAGAPSGTLADANATITVASSTFPSSVAWQTLTFGTPFTLAAGTYWVVLSRSGSLSSSNLINIYTNGAVSGIGPMATYNGSTWTNGGFGGANVWTFELIYSGASYCVTHTIPAGTFPAGITKAICAPKIVDWETGADIQFKLTNGTDDTGWLTAGVSPSVQTFTAFASAPTKLIIKLIPKVSSPTAGYPSVASVGVRATV